MTCFLATLDKGTDRLNQQLEEMRKTGAKVLAGDDAFMLYDT
jgi:alanyl-tRNA synthetase